MLVLKPNIRGIPEIMIGRILMLMWPFLGPPQVYKQMEPPLSSVGFAFL